MAEQWLPVPGFNGYEVSNFGKVRSLDRWVSAKDNRKPRFWAGQELTPGTSNASGHLRVVLNRRSYYVHRLVLTAFVGPCPEGMEACHNDGNPRNNALENLRWDTRKGNFADKVKHGTALTGSANHRTHLMDADVLAIRHSSEPYNVLAERYGVTDRTISKIMLHHDWKHVGGPMQRRRSLSKRRAS